jgi:hypothetical protein
MDARGELPIRLARDRTESPFSIADGMIEESYGQYKGAQKQIEVRIAYQGNADADEI